LNSANIIRRGWQPISINLPPQASSAAQARAGIIYGVFESRTNCSRVPRFGLWRDQWFQFRPVLTAPFLTGQRIEVEEK
jgi:hypothetical protein